MPKMKSRKPQKRACPPKRGGRHEHHQLHQIELALARLHRLVTNQGAKIMGTQTQATQDMKDLKAKMVKVAGEVQTLIDKVNNLPPPDSTGAEFDAALADLKAQAQVVDDLNADAPTA